MKKFSIFTTILLSLGMFVFSCSKVKETAIQTPEGIEETINNAQPVEMTFVATVAAKPATKSVDASGVTAWVAGEEIAVYYQKTDLSYATATATVGTPNGDGSASISATLSDAKDGSAVKFVYPAGLVNASGDLDASKLAAQHGTIADISANFDAATASGTLVTDGTTCGTSAQISMVNQVLIGKFTPSYNSSPIDGITKLTIIDGSIEYNVTPSSGTFGTDGIYVSMLPVDNKEVTIVAVTASSSYTFSKSGISLGAGNLYNNLAIPMATGTLIRVDNKTADILRTTLASASSGDVILMAEGTYIESANNYIAFSSGKTITVRANAGASVLIQPKVPVTISGGSTAKFVDVKFDASHLHDVNSWYEHLIYADDDNANNRLILENCEMYDFTLNKSLIYCSTSNKFASVSFNNCYFHDIKKSVFFAEGRAAQAADPTAEPPKEAKDAITSVGSFSLTNSTVAAITTESSYYAGVFDARGPEAVITVDHCTFYDCHAMNTDYGTIKVNESTQTSNVVSNCIFALPSTAAERAIHFSDASKGQIMNCIVYNYTASDSGIRKGGATKTSCSSDNPLFTEAASKNFTLGTGSPALTASATGGPIGDPRWY